MTATKKKVVKKKVAKKKVVKKKRPVKKAAKPIPKYHINQKEWDKKAVMDIVCKQLLESSRGLASILRSDPDLPGVSTVFDWLNQEDAIRKAGGDTPILDMYTRAKELQGDYMADELLDIVDDARNDWMDKQLGNGETIRVVDHEHIQRSRLRADTRKWLASKLNHRKYGDKLELANNPERPLSTLSDEELSARIKLLQDQAGAGPK